MLPVRLGLAARAGRSYAAMLETSKCLAEEKRTAHTDVQFPNFDNYRLDSTKDPNKPALETEDDRRGVPNAIIYGVGGMVSLLAVKQIAQTAVYYKAMAADQRALASIEVDMNDIPEGQTKTYEWRGKPVFVKHRTAAEIKREKAVNVSELRHPQTDDERVQVDEWSVVIANAGDFGGYYCPCHGSHYDASGRIRKGPAPLNLNLPAYSIKGDVIVVGSSASRFFGFVALVSIVFVIVMLFVYLCKWGVYAGDDRVPKLDLIITLVIAVGWFLATWIWWGATNGLEDATDPNHVRDKFKKLRFCDSTKEDCDFYSYAAYAPLTVSIIAGFACLILFGTNVWFVYKETSWFRERQAGQMNSGPTNFGGNLASTAEDK
ncbi:Cytochrome b-c1 complex subunit Rieske, mitochondrial [Aphelenchoides besseyi]|nr:Cytochrome b-c1 complex subunit Rieske, mitochondrial [Aphelenchoides besseyi]KAI6212036.1 Cytochrome b-c1 complex subunit Rieske, mitochondrial [Aphelenchoides besseyi]